MNIFEGIQQTAPAWAHAMRDIAPPAPTTAPLLWRNALGIRQATTQQEDTTEVVSETCAWFSHTVSSLGWEALACDEPCTTSGTLFGCNVIPETCNDLTADVCQSTATDSAVCCDSTFPYCITGVLEQDGNTFTAFRCGNDALSGEMDIYDDTTQVITTTFSEGDDGTTVTVTQTPTDSPTESAGDSTDDTGNPGESSDSASENEGSPSGGGGGGAPVGAIVGGVIGGVALIVGVAFAIWFIRFQKKKQANKAQGSGMEPYRYDQNYAAAAGGYPQQTQQPGYDYSQGGYNNGQYVLPPTFSQAGGSPKPEDQQMQQVQQQPPVEMPEHANFGAPSELPSEGTSSARR